MGSITFQNWAALSGLGFWRGIGLPWALPRALLVRPFGPKMRGLAVSLYGRGPWAAHRDDLWDLMERTGRKPQVYQDRGGFPPGGVCPKCKNEPEK
jgi:hypothetical protein